MKDPRAWRQERKDREIERNDRRGSKCGSNNINEK
jgi:hypothetical protein